MPKCLKYRPNFKTGLLFWPGFKVDYGNMSHIIPRDAKITSISLNSRALNLLGKWHLLYLFIHVIIILDIAFNLNNKYIINIYKLN